MKKILLISGTRSIYRLMLRLKTACLLVYAPLIFFAQSKEWVQTAAPENGQVLCLHSSGNTLFAGIGGLGLWKSEDEGVSWLAVNEGMTEYNPRTITEKNKVLYTGMGNGGVYRSADAGKTWEKRNKGLQCASVWSLTFKDDLLFAGTSNGIFLSKDDALSWQAVALPIPPGGSGNLVRTLCVQKNRILAGVGSAVYWSDDNGASWSAVQVDSLLDVTKIVALDPQTLLLGTSGNGIALSTDEGSSWGAKEKIDKSPGNSNNNINDLLVADSLALAATFGKGIFKSGKDFSKGLKDLAISCLVVHGDRLYAGTYLKGVWKLDIKGEKPFDTPLSSAPRFTGTLSVSPAPSLPGSPILFRYQLPEQEDITLTIFDGNGKNIQTVASGLYEAGVYDARCATQLSTGLYYAVLRTADGAVITQKFEVVH